MNKFRLINIIGLAFILYVIAPMQLVSGPIKKVSSSVQEPSCIKKQQFKLYSVPETVNECVVIRDHQKCSKRGFFVVSAKFSVLLVEETQVVVKDICNGGTISDDEVTTQKAQDIGPFGISKCINQDLETVTDTDVFTGTDDPIKIAMDLCETKRKIYLGKLEKRL